MIQSKVSVHVSESVCLSVCISVCVCVFYVYASAITRYSAKSTYVVVIQFTEDFDFSEGPYG